MKNRLQMIVYWVSITIQMKQISQLNRINILEIYKIPINISL